MVARVVWALAAFAAWVYILVSPAPGWAKALSVMIAAGFYELSRRHRDP